MGERRSRVSGKAETSERVFSQGLVENRPSVGHEGFLVGKGTM